ncbi:hypothetical protein NLU13_1657 [Sarocladium strictum]|uniref:Uncharacterized protein n=1 Tax=Sarocladium strictum TaxID=5046 RepID=A0AA39GS53_SARSR|nr:hypothetical protein NLU13_1657 [Sarocladium strictum]
MHIHLSAAVDVYGEWVDAADAVAKESNVEPSSYTGTARRSRKDDAREYAIGSRDEAPTYSGEGIVGDDEDY